MQKLIVSTVCGVIAASALFAGDRVEAETSIADANHYLFVPNRSSADVAVIDTRTDTVVARVEVGNVPHQIAISEVAGVFVASNTEDDTISVIDLATFGTVATITLDNEPEHMELSPDGLTLAVGNIGAGTVSMISLVDRREVARVDGLFEPHNLTFSPDGSRLYVANLGANHISVIDTATAALVDEIVVVDPVAMAHAGEDAAEYQGIINVTRTPDGRLGFAAHGEGDTLVALDLRTGEKLATVALGEMPWRAYSTADGRYMIVPNNGDETISIISTTTLKEVARLPGAADMTGVNTGWFETTAFVISRGDDKAVIIDLVEMAVVGEIALPSSPETGVTTPDGTKLYVALSGSNQVAVIDIRSRTLTALIDGVGEEPWGATMIGALNYCH